MLRVWELCFKALSIKSYHLCAVRTRTHLSFTVATFSGEENTQWNEVRKEGVEQQQL